MSNEWMAFSCRNQDCEIDHEDADIEKEYNALDRMASLYIEMADEFKYKGKTRRWHSLMRRAENIRKWWHV